MLADLVGKFLVNSTYYESPSLPPKLAIGLKVDYLYTKWVSGDGTYSETFWSVLRPLSVFST